MKKLEEIEARINLAAPWMEAVVVGGAIYNRARSMHHADAVAHAPDDLALLARLVRSVAEAECFKDPMRLTGETCEQRTPNMLCITCHIRRQLEAAR